MFVLCRAFVSFTDPVSCSLVLVGGQYSSNLAPVLQLLDRITEQTDRVITAVFILSDQEAEMEYNETDIRNPSSPLLVSPELYFHN